MVEVPRQAGYYQGRTAGLVTRTVAALIDGLLLLLALLVAYAALAGVLFVLSPRSFSLPKGGIVLSLSTAAAMATVYLTSSWWLSGRTYGDRVMGLRVVTRRGGRLRLGIALLRALLCIGLPIGLLWVAVSRENRSLQDLVLRTSVVYDWLDVVTAVP